MIRTTITAFFALSISAGICSAEDGGFYVDGKLQFESYSSGFSSGRTAFFGDLTIGFAPEPISSAGFGAELSMERLDATGVATDIDQYYATIYWNLGNGRLSVGAPRSALDTYMPDNAFSHIGTYNQQIDAFSLSAVTTGQVIADDIAYGLRYDGSHKTTDFGISYHHGPDTGYDAISLGLRHQMGNTTISAGLEYADRPGGHSEFYGFGLEFDLDRWNLTFTHNGSEPGGISITSARADYMMNDQLRLGLAAMRTNTGSDTFGLDATWNFWQGAFGQLSVIDRNSGTDYVAAVGYSF